MLNENRTENNQTTLRAVARVALFAAAATPAILFAGFFFPFVTPRNVFFRLCVEAALALLLVPGIRRLRDIDGEGDVVLRWFGIYLGALALTSVTGLAPWHSVFGDFERMGGVFAWLHLFLFYCLLRMVLRERDWIVFFRIIVVVADLVVFWGALEFLPASVRNPLFQTTLGAGSTIGNPGLLGPYLLLATALSLLDVMRAPSRFWRTASTLSFFILLFGIGGSRNRSSELGLLVGLASGLCVYFTYSKNRRSLARKFAVAAAGALAVFAISAALISAGAPRLADRFGGRWKGFLSSPIDHSRTIEWKIALEGFRDRPLLGYGPENHQIVASHHFDPQIYAVLGEGSFDRTHNAWLELLATSGLLGALAMAGLWLAVLNTVRRGAREGALDRGEAAILSGALLAYAVYLTFWFFDVNSAIIWVAILAYLTSRVNGILDVSLEEKKSRLHPFGWATIAVTVAAAYFHAVIPLRAAHDLSIAAASGGFNQRLTAFEKVFNSSVPQTMHTFPVYYRFLRSAEPDMARFGTNPFLRKEFELAMRRGLIEAGRHIARNNSDDRSYVDAARLFSLAALYYSDVRYLRLAKADLVKALQISPKRADSRVLLAGVDRTLQDTAAADAQLDTALKLAPQFLPTFVYAGKAQLSKGKVDSSAALLLRAAGGRDPVVGTLFRAIIDSLSVGGESGRAAELGTRYLRAVFGPPHTWVHVADLPGTNRFAVEIAGIIPILYARAGDQRRALEAAAYLVRLQPAARVAAAQFAADVSSGRASKWTSSETLVPPSPAPGSSVPPP